MNIPIQPISIDRSVLVSAVQPVTAVQQLSAQTKIEKTQLLDESGKTFADYIRDQISGVVGLQQKADTMVQAYATGQQVNLQDMVLAAQRASLGLSLAITVRNKVLEAYTEISRMPV